MADVSGVQNNSGRQDMAKRRNNGQASIDVSSGGKVPASNKGSSQKRTLPKSKSSPAYILQLSPDAQKLLGP